MCDEWWSDQIKGVFVACIGFVFLLLIMHYVDNYNLRTSISEEQSTFYSACIKTSNEDHCNLLWKTFGEK